MDLINKKNKLKQLFFSKRFNGKNENIALTSREIECINWLIEGKSAEEIGLILSLSRRTVESHINNIKKKTRCYKQFQLGYLFGKYEEVLL